MRWTDRLLGLISTLVLARLLVPEDFGLIAMAMVFAGLLDVVLDLGVSAALVQNSRADAQHFNTAWTLRLCQASATAVAIALCAPLVADYYGDPRVVPILYVVAVTALVGGLENIGTVSFHRNMEFGRDFQFLFYKRVVGVVFTFTAAFLLRSYWALVLGSLASRIAGVGISYGLSAFRPRISLGRFADIWSYSQWNMVASLGHYLANGLSRLVIGHRADASVLGAYSMGEEIAQIPTTELLAPLGRVMFPVFAAAKHDSEELLRLVRLALGVQSLVAIPAGIGVALVAHDAIAVLLGDKWADAVIYAQIIALASVATALGHSAVYMLSANGMIKAVAVYNWSKVGMLLVLITVIFPSSDARGVAIAYLATAYGGLAVVQSLARRVVRGFGIREFLLATWRPLTSAVLMAVVIGLIAPTMKSSMPVLRLLVEILVGGATYVASVVTLWWSVGRPQGAETYIFQKISARRRG